MRPSIVKTGLQLTLPLLVCLATTRRSWAQTSQDDSSPPPAQTLQKTDDSSAQNDPSDPLTLFPHSESSRYWISGQANLVFQWHPTFRALYSGPNSLSPAQSATTHVVTLYLGYELTHTTEVFADVEDATGGGIGGALGLAGYSDLDSVRTVQGIALSKAPYLARLMLRQIIPLTDKEVKAERDPFSSGHYTSSAAHRISRRKDGRRRLL